jgi:hypothetical protein
MVREDEMIMISEDEYQEHMDEEFNNGWSEFKDLVLGYINENYSDTRFGDGLHLDIEDLC